MSKCMLIVACGVLVSIPNILLAQTEIDACKRIKAETERLACYDRALEFEGVEKIERPLGDAEIKSVFHKDGAASASKQVIFIRSATSIAADNGDPAEIALSQSGGRTTGSAKAALLWIPDGKLGVLSTDAVGGLKPYFGLGFERDKTKELQSEQVATQTLRAGLRSVFKARGKLQTGAAGAYEVALRIQNDDVNDSRTTSLELPVDSNYHWVSANTRMDLLLMDRWVYAGVTPYLDHVSHTVANEPASRRGIAFRLGAGVTVPELPESFVTLNKLRPDLIHWGSEHVRQLNGSESRSTKHTLSTSWIIHRSHNGQQGIKLERIVGSNFRDGEDKDVAKTSVKLTVKY